MTDAAPNRAAEVVDGDDTFARDLARLLEATLPDPPVTLTSLTRAAGGLSWETWYAEVRTGPAGQPRTLVAKRPPLDGPLAPYDVDKEVAIADALARADVPGPVMAACATGATVAGRPVMVMEFAAGEIPSLRSIEQWPAWQDDTRRRQVGGRLMELLAGVQGIDWRSTAHVATALHGELELAGHVRAAIDRLMGKVDAVAPRWAPVPALRDAWLWLTDHVPADDGRGPVIVHGDFRIGNVVWRDDRPVALLDWERASLGDPLCDLGFFCMPMARSRRPELMGMLLTSGELLATYAAATGAAVDLRRLHYYLIYWQFVELAQVAHGIAYLLDRAPDGDTTSLTSYPLLSSGTIEMIDLIERFEDGDHVLR